MKKQIQVPFDHKGNMLGYAQDYFTYQANPYKYNRHSPVMVDNFEFGDNLHTPTLSRGRSKTNIVLTRRSTQTTIEMTASMYLDLLNKSEHTEGIISGTFTFKKQGANYHCVPVE